MLNFNNLNRSMQAYGGLACKKDGVIYNGEPYLMKYPANLKDKNLKGVDLSYANDSVNEHLGSNIFRLLGMPAQETLLGIASDKIVVLCKDFAIDCNLIEFNKIKTTSTRDVMESEGSDSTNGAGTNIHGTLEVVRNSMFFEGLPAEEFFWKMFVIDYVIDNPDRNNGNWGILVKNGERTMAPIYDCGNCLESKWDDDKCKKTLAESDLLEDVVWRRKLSFFTDDKGSRIKPISLIKSGEFPLCTLAVKEIIEKDFTEVFRFIRDCECLTNIRKEFYCVTINARIDKLREIYKNELSMMQLF